MIHTTIPRCARVAACAAFIGLGTTATSVSANSNEIKNTPGLLGKIDAGYSCVFDNTVTGFEAKYNLESTIKDHIQGITMTKDGRMVATFSMGGAKSEGGYLLVSEKIDLNRVPSLKDSKPKWKYHRLENSLVDYNYNSVYPKHPSNLQAANNYVLVGQWPFPIIYEIDASGSVTPISAKWGSDLRLNREHWKEESEAVGFVYNPNDQRYYAFASNGTTSVGDGQSLILLHRSDPPGADLTGKSFQSLGYINAGTNIGVPALFEISASGSSLLADRDGTLFLASTFHGGDVVAYQISVIGGFFAAFPIGFDGNTVLSVGKTQIGPARPRWRFGGGIAPIGDSLAVLWSGRGALIGNNFDDDDLEVALQVISPGGFKTCD